jgi:hypothetical protein
MHRKLAFFREFYLSFALKVGRVSPSPRGAYFLVLTCLSVCVISKVHVLKLGGFIFLQTGSFRYSWIHLVIFLASSYSSTFRYGQLLRGKGQRA